MQNFKRRDSEEGEVEVKENEKFARLLELYGTTPESVRMLCKMRAVEILKRTARFFEGNVASGKYVIIKDFVSDNPALLIKVILVPEEEEKGREGGG